MPEVTDEMIARASFPNAAALLRKAMDKGLIPATTAYAPALSAQEVTP